MTTRNYEHVRLDIDGNVATITFDAPRFRNALGIQAMQDVIDIFDDIEADKAVGAVVLTGAGDVWSAGFQLKEVEGLQDADSARIRRHFRKASLWWHEILHRIVRTPKPVIAKVNGIVAGGPVGMVAACDMAFCNESASFFCAWHTIGIANDAGSSYIFAKVVGFRRAMDLLLTNRTLDSATALDWGLVNAVYPDAELDAKVDPIIRQLADGPTHLQALAKATLHNGWNMSLEECTEFERLNVLESVSDPHFKERLAAFLRGEKSDQARVVIP